MTVGGNALTVLGQQEALRLTRHPLVLTGAVLGTAMALTTLPDRNPVYDYQALTLLHSFTMGPLILIAANLLARREHRAATRQVVAATPVTERDQVASVLCAAVGPALMTAVLVAFTLMMFRLLSADPLSWPGAAELAVQPVRLLGAGLLGVMVARWLPGPVRPALLACVVAVAWTGVGRSDNATLRTNLVALFVFNDPRGGSFSVGWHVVYLLCLDAMAATGALLATPGPRRALLTAGVASGAGAVFTGWMQLR